MFSYFCRRSDSLARHPVLLALFGILSGYGIASVVAHTSGTGYTGSMVIAGLLLFLPIVVMFAFSGMVCCSRRKTYDRWREEFSRRYGLRPSSMSSSLADPNSEG